MFDAFTAADVGLETVREPAFELGAWLVPTGGAPGDLGFSAIVVASSNHLFSITLLQPLDDTFDGPAFVADVARRQIAAAGGESGLDAELPVRQVDDADLLVIEPAASHHPEQCHRAPTVFSRRTTTGRRHPAP